MKLSKSTSLTISIICIVLFWAWAIIRSQIPHQGPEPLKIILMKAGYFAVITLLLWISQENFTSIGFKREKLLRQIAIGLGLGAIIWVVQHLLTDPVLKALLPSQNTEAIDMSIYFKETSSMLTWLFIGIFGGGVVEELQRIFIMTRFEKIGGKYGLIISIVIHSMIFGSGHLYQGLPIAVGTGILGVINSLVYLRKRSAVEAIVCHAIFDAIGILSVFLISH